MANTRDIKRKIVSVQNTQKITKAMKMVSAAKMRRAVENMYTGRAYTDKLKSLVIELRRRLKEDTSHPYLTDRKEVRNVGLLVVNSDKGLCGAFNSSVVKMANEFIGKQLTDGKTVKLYIVGKKAYDYFKNRQADNIKASWISFGGKYTYSNVSLVTSNMISDFESEDIDEIYMAYNKYESTATQTTTLDKVVPVDISSIETTEIEESEKATVLDFIFEPSKESILEDILPKYINTVLYQSMLESAAGEHSARMVAMESATQAAGDMIKRLVVYYNKARQGAITKELLDIVNGAEALK